jgi:hypothetical protein
MGKARNQLLEEPWWMGYAHNQLREGPWAMGKAHNSLMEGCTWSPYTINFC